MTTLSNSAKAALTELQSDVNRLRQACDSAFFANDEAVCGGVADAAQRFLTTTAPPLVSRIAAGDLDAAARLSRALANIRVQVREEAELASTVLSTGGLAQRFFSEVVVQTGIDAKNEAVAATKSAAPWVLGGVGVVFGLWAWKNFG